MALGPPAGSALLDVLGEVQATLHDVADVRMPQVVLVGKESAGKYRFLEALAGEELDLCLGVLGSRRPTVYEFRRASSATTSSRWAVRDRNSHQWTECSSQDALRAVGSAHEELGRTVSPDPVHLRIEAPSCANLQIIDLPGFRDVAPDESNKDICEKIEALVAPVLSMKNSILLAFEEQEQGQEGEASAILAKCLKVDPKHERTVLLRASMEDVSQQRPRRDSSATQWAKNEGFFQKLPETLVAFALTLPTWREGLQPPTALEFSRRCLSMDEEDTVSFGLANGQKHSIGLKSFLAFVEKKEEQLFAGSLAAVMGNLKSLRDRADKREKELAAEFQRTDPHSILRTACDCGASFATALTHVMEGRLNSQAGIMTLEQELRSFHEFHTSPENTRPVENLSLLPSQEFKSRDDYVAYLTNEIQVSACDVEVNGGAQFRRLLSEVEIFLRFSEIGSETSKRDVIQARGAGSCGSGSAMNAMTWRDVVLKLLNSAARTPLQGRVRYVGERLKWFFIRQKEAVLEFMDSLEGTPDARLFSPLYPKHVKVIKSNEFVKRLIFDTYDRACDRQLQQFVELFENMLTSTFSNPWVFLKSGDDFSDDSLPSFDETKERLPKEFQGRSCVETSLSKQLNDIPTDARQIDEAVEKVQLLIEKTYCFIRSHVCDQVELFAESFFKLPMMRRLEQDMSLMTLPEMDKAGAQGKKRERLVVDMEACRSCLAAIELSSERLQGFSLSQQAGRGGGW